MKKSIPLTFILFKYFPFGGLQRDFIKIAKECALSGFKITVYTMSWQGDIPKDFKVITFKPSSFTNCGRNKEFYLKVQKSLQTQKSTFVIGFNKMPGLDIYYGADTCFKHKALTLKSFFYRLGNRYRHYTAWEKEVFKPSSSTKIMLISAAQLEHFQHYYKTQSNRITVLPPGIEKNRCHSQNAPQLRQIFRKKYNISQNEKLLIFLGSGFKTKGLDRAIIAVSKLPDLVKDKVKFFVIGQDKSKLFQLQAKKLNINNQISFFYGLEDIQSLLQGADGLIHPAYNENTGTVLLEALVAGLPVLCTDVCGYAHYIQDAQAGIVAKSPFNQTKFNSQTNSLLFSDQQNYWKKNALLFASKNDLHSQTKNATDYITQIYEEHCKSKLK